MIPDEKVREVAERLSIFEVVSDYVQLRRSGANYLGLCPFHTEKTPSFNVNPAREIFHCFGCGAGGNSFSFIMKMEGVSFPEAVKLLARKAGVEIEERQLTPSEIRAQNERQQFQRINELAAGYFRTTLEQKPEGAIARQYLEERGVDSETSAAYLLGFAPDRSDGLVQYLKANGSDLENALKLGVVRKSERGWYDQFRNRLIFPIRDAKGLVIAFAGRVLDASLPKYINSPESPLYHKSAVLFGMDMALPSIRTENSVIIVEGYFDHLALYRAGIRNVVATCGTALTATHSGQIKRHAERVYMLFDSDAAGRKATIRSMELFLEQRMPAYVITLPAGDDPDSFLAKNPVEAFHACRDKARSAFDFFIRSLLLQTPPKNVENKIKVINELSPSFKKIQSPIERNLYEKEICRLLDIPVHEFRKYIGGIKSQHIELSSTGSSILTGDRAQETLLAIICRYPEAREEIKKYGTNSLFKGYYQELADIILNETSDTDNINLSNFFNRLDSDELKNILSRLLVVDEQIEGINWQVAFEQCRKGHENKQVSFKEIISRLALIDPDSQEYTALLQQADALRTRKSKL
jgi:DNA primase